MKIVKFYYNKQRFCNATAVMVEYTKGRVK